MNWSGELGHQMIGKIYEILIMSVCLISTFLPSFSNIEDESPPRKQVSFSIVDNTDSDKRRISNLEKKLRRKQNEVQNLEKNLEHSRTLELTLRNQLSELQSELAENEKLSNKSILKDLEETRLCLSSKEKEIDCLKQEKDYLKDKLIKIEEKSSNEDVFKNQLEELERLRALVDEAEDIAFQKDMEIAQLNEKVSKDQEDIKVDAMNYICYKTFVITGKGKQFSQS